jgi:glycosyltransferase involved in cell wall biosynthesis
MKSGRVKLRFCIVGQNLERAMRGDYAGGAEKQQAEIARGLILRSVSVLILDLLYDGPTVTIDGIELRPLKTTASGNPVICRLTAARQLADELHRSRADVFYIRGMSPVFGTVLAWTKIAGKKFIWGMAHDRHLNPRLLWPVTWQLKGVNRLYHHGRLLANTTAGIKLADRVLCQTLQQMEAVRKRGRRGRLLRNIFSSTAPPRAEQLSAELLWVGKFTGRKGERELLQLARLLPHRRIRVICPLSGAFFGTETAREIQAQPNLVLVGHMEYQDVLAEMSRAPMLIHTGLLEGFANVFIEAWACGCPVVSLFVDPDKLLSSGSLGFCALGSLEKMVEQIEVLSKDPGGNREIGRRGVEYVAIRHAPETVVGEMLTILESLRRHSGR